MTLTENGPVTALIAVHVAKFDKLTEVYVPL